MKILFTILTLALGALAGFLFYKYIGCKGGNWGIYRNVWSSVIFGAIVGYLLLSPVVDRYFAKKNSENKTEEIDIRQ